MKMDLDKFPPVCSFFGIRKQVMSNSMKRIREKEAAGQPVTNKAFGRIVKDEWDKAKAEQERVCGGL